MLKARVRDNGRGHFYLYDSLQTIDQEASMALSSETIGCEVKAENGPNLYVAIKTIFRPKIVGSLKWIVTLRGSEKKNSLTRAMFVIGIVASTR